MHSNMLQYYNWKTNIHSNMLQYHNWNYNDADKILKFDIPFINNSLKLNNDLFNKKITTKLLKKVKRIKKCYTCLIKENHREKLDDFLKEIKNNSIFEISDEKLISFMIIANEEIYHQTPRVIQIICLLFYLEGYKENYNLILEVLTGEGKTLTISFLALYLAIIGNKVDILTSSPVLAERDSKDREKFYNYFGISCDFCRFDSNGNSNSKSFECYKADIVYGDSTNLIGDILRSEFLGKKGRGDRPFDYIIIDEIDNICIDNLRNIVELVDNFPGYKYLEYLSLFIYRLLTKKVNKLKKDNGKNFEKILKEKAELILHEINKNTREFLYSNKKLKFDDKNKILIPESFYDFFDSRIEHWCKMAYDAMFNFKLNQNYFISKDDNYDFKTIKPIDYENTGVILKNSIWSGLHQFLQIKEGLTFTEENINSSFMSYLSFFKKYKIINGITGTLGSKKTQKAMKIIYKINLLRMPPFKARSLQIYEPKTFSDEKLYKEKLINEIIEFSAHHKRVVLVIFEYMSQVQEMHKYLNEHRKEFKLENSEIISYFRSDIENKFLEKQMKPNTIIISTNLSGRGTDIKIDSEVKKNGGLHVIITFMPYNERTENQAQGRAGRCGDKGSSITMVLAKNNYETLKKRRAEYELGQYKFLINLYVPQSHLCQKFFEEFCETLHQIEEENTDISKNIISDLKERWSMFILKNNINSFMNDSINENCAKQVYILYERITSKNFKDLMKEIKVENLEDYKFYNPFNQIKSNLPNKLYQNAIDSNPGFFIGAYYNQAYSVIKKRETEKIPNYQILVFKNFKTLKIICNKFIDQYNEYLDVFYEIHDNDKKYYESDFSKQIQYKKKIMAYILKNIELNLDVIEIFSNHPTLKKINKSNLNLKDLKNLKELKNWKELFTYVDIDILNIFNINKIKDDLNVPQNALDYFKDFGIEYLFEIECKEKNKCLIF